MAGCVNKLEPKFIKNFLRCTCPVSNFEGDTSFNVTLWENPFYQHICICQSYTSTDLFFSWDKDYVNPNSHDHIWRIDILSKILVFLTKKTPVI